MDDFEPIEEHKDFNNIKFNQENFQPLQNSEQKDAFEVFEPQGDFNEADNFEAVESSQNQFDNFDGFDGFSNFEGEQAGNQNFDPEYNDDGFESYQNFDEDKNYSDSFEQFSGINEPEQSHFQSFQTFETINESDYVDGQQQEKESDKSFNEEEMTTDAEVVNEEEEEKDNNYATKIGLVITVLILAGFSFILFHGLAEKNKKYKEVVVERPAPTNRVDDLHIIPNSSVFKEGERFKFDISRDVFVEGELSEVILSFKIPEDIPYKQKIDGLIVVPTPEKFEKEDDGTYAYVRVIKPRGSIQLHVSGFATINNYTLEKAEKLGKNFDGVLSEEAKKKYLSPEKNIESNSDVIRTASAKFIPRAMNEIDTVKNIFDFVVVMLRYDEKNIGKVRGALTALRQKTGACNEFADLMVALCRTKGIPARVQYGFDIPFSNLQRLSNNGHAWAEVWFPEYGWVLFDPTNKVSPSLIQDANDLKVTPYELFAYAFQNRIYLTVDMNEIHMHYKGNGTIRSENLHVKFMKAK